MTEKQYSNFWARLSPILKTIGVAFVLMWVFLLTPAIAQNNLKAPVVVDGSELFQVGSSGGFQAKERADTANFQLREAIESGRPPQVEVAGNSNLPTILLNGSHFLTVTEQDTLPGRGQLDQAQLWAEQLKYEVQEAQQQRTTGYLQQAGLLSLGVLVVALLLHWGLGRFWRRTLRPELRAVTYIPDPDSITSEQPASLDLLLSLLLAIMRAGLWVGAALYITNLFPRTRQWSYQITGILVSSFVSPIFTLGQRKYSVTDLLILAGLLFVLEIFTKTVTNLLKTRLLRVTVANRGAREAIAIIIRYALLFVGALVLLQAWGIDISSLAILASALGIGIGLGLQDIAKDFGSGLVLVFERPIQVGDFVQVGDFQGTIERIGTRSTLIRTLDHISIIVPNSRFLSGEVINWSHDNPVSRLHLPVGVAYGSDMEAVRAALLQAAQEQPKVLLTPQPQVLFKGFGDNALEVELLVWTSEPSKQFLLKSELYFRIEAQLRQHEVEIPFPQRDVNVRTGNLPIELSPQLEQTLQQLLKQSQNGQRSQTQDGQQQGLKS
jgi:potassium efflux system protein